MTTISKCEFFEDIGIAIYEEHGETFSISSSPDACPVKIDRSRVLFSDGDDSFGFICRNIHFSSIIQMLMDLYRAHNAWHFFQIAIDVNSSEKRRVRAVNGIERRLSHTCSTKYLRTKLILSPLIEQSDTRGAKEIANKNYCLETAKLIQDLADRQNAINYSFKKISEGINKIIKCDDFNTILEAGNEIFININDIYNSDINNGRLLAFKLIEKMEIDNNVSETLKDFLYEIFDKNNDAIAVEYNTQTKLDRRRIGRNRTVKVKFENNDTKEGKNPEFNENDIYYWFSILQNWPNETTVNDTDYLGASVRKKANSIISKIKINNINIFWKYLSEFLLHFRGSINRAQLFNALTHISIQASNKGAIEISDKISNALLGFIPGSQVTYIQRINFLKQVKKYDELDDLYQKCIRKFPNVVNFREERGLLMEKLGYTEKAINIYNETIEYFSGEILSAARLSHILIINESYSRSRDVISRSIAMTNNWVGAIFNAVICIKEGYYSRSEVILRDSINNCPKQRRSTFDMAFVVTHLALESYQTALDYLNATEQDSYNARTFSKLLRLHAMGGLNRMADAIKIKHEILTSSDVQNRLKGELNKLYGLSDIRTQKISKRDVRDLTKSVINMEADLLLKLIRKSWDKSFDD